MFDISLLNSAQKDAIEELRKRVENDMPSDTVDDRIIYYKFLKARDFNVDRAEKMLKKNIQWRKHHQLSNIMENFKPKDYFLELVEPSFIGFDKEGDIVLFSPMGLLDARDVLKCVTLNDYIKHWAWFCEKWSIFMKQRREKEGKKSQQLFLIFDLDGLTFANTTSKASKDTVLKTMNVLQDNFPETIKCMSLINAPPYYVFLMSLLKPVLSAATLRKIHVQGRFGWRELFLETIDAEVLPAFLGGERIDPDGDPSSKTIMSHEGCIPKSYYLPDEDRDFKDKSRVTKITVPFSSKKDVYFDVTNEESIIQWEFLVKNKDIRFGLFYQGSNDEVEILPSEKYETVDGVEKGYFKAKVAGKYFITFDNSHSWLNSKEIEYCITVSKKMFKE